MDDAGITRSALAARRGDETAAAQFVRATTPQVRRLLQYLGADDQVDDLVQETYLRAFAGLRGYGGAAPARHWLLGIARRVAADHVRDAQRHPRTRPASGLPEAGSRAVAGPAGVVAVRQAIAALPAERREAFVLTRVVGLSYAEAAGVCGCPVGTVRSRVYRARCDLIAALADHATGTDACG